jgi:hypothetical protein
MDVSGHLEDAVVLASRETKSKYALDRRLRKLMMKYKSFGRRMIFENTGLDILSPDLVKKWPNSQAEDDVNKQVRPSGNGCIREVLGSNLRRHAVFSDELSLFTRTLGSWVRISLKGWMFVCVYSVCVLGSGLATG